MDYPGLVAETQSIASISLLDDRGSKTSTLPSGTVDFCSYTLPPSSAVNVSR